MGRDVAVVVTDYTLFSLLAGATLVLPFYIKRSQKTQKNSKLEYVFAHGSNIPASAILISLLKGSLGVRPFIAYPAEMYYNGTKLYEIIYGIILAGPVCMYLFIPVYYNIGIVSVYEYLDMRFKSRIIRRLSSGMYIFRNLLNSSVIILIPCIALKVFLGSPYWISILSITTISVFCAFSGGLKAVIVLDTFQGLIAFLCLLLIIIRAIIDVGGIVNTFNINYDKDRFHFLNFDLNPEIRVTTVSAVTGQFFMSLYLWGCQQHLIQKYSSVKSLPKVQKIFSLVLPLNAIMFSLFWVCGSAIFATYSECDPLTLGYISKIDEILPFYVLNAFENVPGIIGIFLATLFNGSLSLFVPNLNSMATVAWEDFFKLATRFKSFSEKQELMAIKILVIVTGIFTAIICFGVAMLPGLAEGSLIMTSATSGPLLGVFLLALFFPSCNWKGACAGMVVSFSFSIFIMLGSIITGKEEMEFLPLSVDGCTNETFPAETTFLTEWGKPAVDWQTFNASKYYKPQNKTDVTDRSFWDHLFSITFLYYAVIDTFVCVILGLIVSYCAGTNESEIYDQKLIHPFALKVSKMFPGTPRKYLTEATNKDSNEKSVPSLSQSSSPSSIPLESSITSLPTESSITSLPTECSITSPPPKSFVTSSTTL